MDRKGSKGSFKAIDHLPCLTCALFLAEAVRPDFQIHVWNTRTESVKAANGKKLRRLMGSK